MKRINLFTILVLAMIGLTQCVNEPSKTETSTNSNPSTVPAVENKEVTNNIPATSSETTAGTKKEEPKEVKESASKSSEMSSKKSAPVKQKKITTKTEPVKTNESVKNETAPITKSEPVKAEAKPVEPKPAEAKPLDTIKAKETDKTAQKVSTQPKNGKITSKSRSGYESYYSGHLKEGEIPPEEFLRKPKFAPTAFSLRDNSANLDPNFYWWWAFRTNSEKVVK